MVLRAFGARGGGPARIVVGCEDGRVVALDGQGGPVGCGAVEGRPTCITTLPPQDGPPLVLVGTRKGHVAGFVVAE